MLGGGCPKQVPVFLECVLENGARWVVCGDGKEWIFVIRWGEVGGRGRGGGRREEKGVAVLGEGADEGILQEVIGIASVQEVGF